MTGLNCSPVCVLLRAAGLMIAHGFTVEQMVEIVRAGLVRRRRAIAMGAGWSGLRHQASSSPRGPCRNTTAGEPRDMKVYLDNVIVSGRVRGDLHPPEEMAAVHALAKADEKGQIEIYTSRWSWAEQDRTRDDFLRVKLKESRGEIEVVADDHRVPRFLESGGPSVRHRVNEPHGHRDRRRTPVFRPQEGRSFGGRCEAPHVRYPQQMRSVCYARHP
jgi:hypothetical protein